MKHTTLVLAFLALLFSQSCKKNDDPVSCGDQLAGNWRAYSIELDGVQWLGYAGTGGFNTFEMEFSGFNLSNNNGDLRITYQYYGQVPAQPISGIFTPSTACDKLDTPAFLASNSNIIRWDIISLTENRLILEANPVGTTYRIKLDKI